MGSLFRPNRYLFPEEIPGIPRFGLFLLAGLVLLDHAERNQLYRCCVKCPIEHAVARIKGDHRNLIDIGGTS